MAFFTQAGEVDLVQDHRVRGDQLFALQAVDDKDRRLCVIEAGKLLGDGVQPFDRAHCRGPIAPGRAAIARTRGV
jgi:hypothetical protein